MTTIIKSEGPVPEIKSNPNYGPCKVIASGINSQVTRHTFRVAVDADKDDGD